MLRAANLIALVLVVSIHYLTATGAFHGMAPAVVSPLTPAPYALYIWVFLYLDLGVFVLFAGRAEVRQVGWWFVLSCLLNACWVLAGSVFILLLWLGCLFRIIFRTQMELTDPPPSTVVFLWWPFCYYTGWCTFMLFVTLGAWLPPSVAWSILLLVVLGIAFLWLTWVRHMREADLVGAWGLIAVGVADQSLVGYVAWGVAAMLLVNCGVHAYLNRKLNPWRKRTNSAPHGDVF